METKEILDIFPIKKDITDFELSPKYMSLITTSIDRLYINYHDKKIIHDNDNMAMQLFRDCMKICYSLTYMKDSNKKDLAKFMFDEVSKRIGLKITSDKFTDDTIDAFEFMIHNKKCCF